MDFELQTRAEDKKTLRKKLEGHYQSTPIPTEQLLTNLGLYFRAPALAKILYLDELYRMVAAVPGDVMEFGGAIPHCSGIIEGHPRTLFETQNDRLRHVRGISGTWRKGRSVQDDRGRRPPYLAGIRHPL